MASILTLIPLIVFGVALFGIFIFFLVGAYGYFLKKDLEGKERGKERIIQSISYLAVLFLVFIAFIGVTYLVKKGEIFNPPQATGEFPASPAGGFPPAPGE